MRYEILDENGNGSGLIIADQSFMDAHYPGRYQIVEESPDPLSRVRKIRLDQFIDRFTMAEKVKVRTSIDPIVQVFEADIRQAQRPYIDLDLPELISGLEYFRDHEILDGATLEERQTRMDTLLEDGL